MSTPTTITLPPWITEDLHTIHQAQDFLNSVEDPSGIEDELGELFEEQLERCNELIDDLMDLLDHLNPPRQGEDR